MNKPGKLWKILRTVKNGNYNYAVVPDHPKADSGGHVPLHRIVMENKLNRILDHSEIVHHIDGNGHNNSIGNLRVMTQSEHVKLHNAQLPHYAEYICTNCEKEFKTIWHKRHPENKNHFCSRSCSALFYNKLFGGGPRSKHRAKISA
jgi:DNA-directed RNA polymerase subunit RPC12/RpoP